MEWSSRVAAHEKLLRRQILWPADLPESKRLLKKAGDAFFENEDAILDPGGCGLLFKQLKRFFDRLMREAEGAVMHRDHPTCIQVEKGARSVGRIGMDIAKLRRVIGSDGQQSELGCQPTADFPKPGKVGSIAGVV